MTITQHPNGIENIASATLVLGSTGLRSLSSTQTRETPGEKWYSVVVEDTIQAHTLPNLGSVIHIMICMEFLPPLTHFPTNVVRQIHALTIRCRQICHQRLLGYLNLINNLQYLSLNLCINRPRDLLIERDVQMAETVLQLPWRRSLLVACRPCDLGGIVKFLHRSAKRCITDADVMALEVSGAYAADIEKLLDISWLVDTLDVCPNGTINVGSLGYLTNLRLRIRDGNAEHCFATLRTVLGHTKICRIVMVFERSRDLYDTSREDWSGIDEYLSHCVKLSRLHVQLCEPSQPKVADLVHCPMLSAKGVFTFFHVADPDMNDICDRVGWW